MPQKAGQVLKAYEIDRSGAHRVVARDGHAEWIVLWDEGSAASVQADRGCLLLRSGDAWQVVDPAWVKKPLTVRIGAQAHTIEPKRGRQVPVN